MYSQVYIYQRPFTGQPGILSSCLLIVISTSLLTICSVPNFNFLPYNPLFFDIKLHQINKVFYTKKFQALASSHKLAITKIINTLFIIPRNLFFLKQENQLIINEHRIPGEDYVPSNGKYEDDVARH